MKYSGYNVTLHTVKAHPAIHHLYEKLEYVSSIHATAQLPEPNIMLRQLGKWTQEYFAPRKWKDAHKLIMEHDRKAGQICVYFESRSESQLTVQYDRKTTG